MAEVSTAMLPSVHRERKCGYVMESNLFVDGMVLTGRSRFASKLNLL